ncbi:MAG TPA: hypothetical protein VJQ56_07900 [Blastocatellia bacterium]|nr:hypothetical protein [Blastocatellia bacterium]
MPNIPSQINGVTVNFAPAVKKNVQQLVIDALKHCISPNVASGHQLNAIFVSSARRQNPNPSRHNTGRAVDISRVNGVKLIVGFNSNAHVTAIVKAIQQKFESFPDRRENFGPHFKKKLGQPFSVPGHKDHIHLSVNG